ncbi:hypothetical protein SPFL3102_02035 [Sporomusaceae bacterium FL31]|nr:hypothetical protein SPFL3101_03669 [Sporomusaceae bacterium FL31]GCE34224.1 hypothetical protein SPFL3102_02035 [Sporomusaceae bacterium]
MRLSEKQIAQRLGVPIGCLKPVDLNQATKGQCTEWILLDHPSEAANLQPELQPGCRLEVQKQSANVDLLCQSEHAAHHQLAVFSLPKMHRVDKKREAEMKRHFGAVDQKIRSSFQDKRTRLFLRQYIDKAFALWQKIV